VPSGYKYCVRAQGVVHNLTFLFTVWTSGLEQSGLQDPSQYRKSWALHGKMQSFSVGTCGTTVDWKGQEQVGAQDLSQ